MTIQTDAAATEVEHTNNRATVERTAESAVPIGIFLDSPLQMAAEGLEQIDILTYSN